MFVEASKKKGTFIVIRCVYFLLASFGEACEQSWTQYHKGVMRVRNKTTVVPSLPKARTNRAESILCWQTETTGQNYHYLYQVSHNAVK